MGSLEIIIGCMYSGKSSELLRRLNALASIKYSTVYVNTQLDTRSEAEFSTHNPMLNCLGDIHAIKTYRLQDIYDTLCTYDVIGIDEASLFDDLFDTVVQLVENTKKQVIIAGLSGTYDRKPFGQIFNLIPYADTIDMLSAYCVVCSNGKKAIFSKRLINTDESIVIGGKDTYAPVCRDCFNQ